MEHPGEHIVLFYNHYYDDVRFIHAPDLGQCGSPAIQMDQHRIT